MFLNHCCSLFLFVILRVIVEAHHRARKLMSILLSQIIHGCLFVQFEEGRVQGLGHARFDCDVQSAAAICLAFIQINFSLGSGPLR